MSFSIVVSTHVPSDVEIDSFGDAPLPLPCCRPERRFEVTEEENGGISLSEMLNSPRRMHDPLVIHQLALVLRSSPEANAQKHELRDLIVCHDTKHLNNVPLCMFVFQVALGLAKPSFFRRSVDLIHAFVDSGLATLCANIASTHLENQKLTREALKTFRAILKRVGKPVADEFIRYGVEEYLKSVLVFYHTDQDRKLIQEVIDTAEQLNCCLRERRTSFVRCM